MVLDPGNDCPPDAASFPTAPDGESVRFNRPSLPRKVEAVEPLEEIREPIPLPFGRRADGFKTSGLGHRAKHRSYPLL